MDAGVLFAYFSGDAFSIIHIAEGEEDLKATAEAIGELSLDENREVGYIYTVQLSLFIISFQVRFHGRTSGLHLIGKNNRTDDRVEGGIWYATILLFCS